MTNCLKMCISYMALSELSVTLTCGIRDRLVSVLTLLVSHSDMKLQWSEVMIAVTIQAQTQCIARVPQASDSR